MNLKIQQLIFARHFDCGTIIEFYKLTHSTGGASVSHPFRNSGSSRFKWASDAGTFLLFRLLGRSAGVQATGLRRRFCTGDGRLYGNANDNRTKQGLGEFHVSFFEVGYMPDKGTGKNVASTGQNRSRKLLFNVAQFSGGVNGAQLRGRLSGAQLRGRLSGGQPGGGRRTIDSGLKRQLF